MDEVVSLRETPALASPNFLFVLSILPQLVISEMVSDAHYYFSFGGLYEITVTENWQFKKLPYDILLLGHIAPNAVAFKRVTRSSYSDDDMMITTLFEKEGQITPDIKRVRDFLRRPAPQIGETQDADGWSHLNYRAERPRITYAIVMSEAGVWTTASIGSYVTFGIDQSEVTISIDEEWKANLFAAADKVWRE